MKRMKPLVIAVGLALCVASSFAWSATAEEKTTSSSSSKKKSVDTKESSLRYPNAIRTAPEQKGEPSLSKLRTQLSNVYEKKKFNEIKPLAEKLRDSEKASAYDKAIAAQLMLIATTQIDANDHATAIPLLEDAIAANALDNDSHYDMMGELSQRLLITQDYEEALKVADRFLLETKSEKIEIMKVKGNALYRLKKYSEAIIVLENVRARMPTDQPVLQLLARAYADAGQSAKALELTKGIAQGSGADDKTAQINLASAYLDAKSFEDAADIIDKLRKEKLLTEERDYIIAKNVYAGMRNKETETIAVLEEGLGKSILKPSANNYNVLAEAYYYSDVDNNILKAIENWKKAASLSKDGVPYLNLAIVQCQEQMWAACKESAKNALAKGGVNPNDAKTQIATADKGLSQSNK